MCSRSHAVNAREHNQCTDYQHINILNLVKKTVPISNNDV